MRNTITGETLYNYIFKDAGCDSLGILTQVIPVVTTVNLANHEGDEEI